MAQETSWWSQPTGMWRVASLQYLWCIRGAWRATNPCTCYALNPGTGLDIWSTARRWSTVPGRWAWSTGLGFSLCAVPTSSHYTFLSLDLGLARSGQVDRGQWPRGLGLAWSRGLAMKVPKGWTKGVGHWLNWYSTLLYNCLRCTTGRLFQFQIILQHSVCLISRITPQNWVKLEGLPILYFIILHNHYTHTEWALRKHQTCVFLARNTLAGFTECYGT